jgi:hypothetical protein
VSPSASDTVKTAETRRAVEAGEILIADSLKYFSNELKLRTAILVLNPVPALTQVV